MILISRTKSREIDATERRRDAIAHLLNLEATVDEWDVMKAEIVKAAATTPVRRRKRSGLMP
jgi:hypothetical protein